MSTSTPWSFVAFVLACATAACTPDQPTTKPADGTALRAERFVERDEGRSDSSTLSHKHVLNETERTRRLQFWERSRQPTAGGEPWAAWISTRAEQVKKGMSHRAVLDLLGDAWQWEPMSSGERWSYPLFDDLLTERNREYSITFLNGVVQSVEYRYECVEVEMR